MSASLQRRLLMLTLLPRHPRRSSAPDLTAALANRGVCVTLRTVERDLEELSTFLPLGSDQRDRPFGWYWTEDAPLRDIPAIDPETALILRVVDAHAAALLPPTARERLQPYISRAEQVLQSGGEQSGLRLWPDRVRVLPGGPPLQPPPISEDIFSTVQQGLLERHCLDIVYRARVREGDPSEYRIHPLALVFREPVTYLVATIRDYNDPRHFAVHRIDRAVLTDQPARDPESGFDLDALIAEGVFDYPEGDWIELELKLNQGAAYHLYETPLAPDQRLDELEDGNVYLKATVQDTARLKWWLLGFGSAVEVVGPDALRNTMIGELRTLATTYGIPSG